jgi:hypothetical protein
MKRTALKRHLRAIFSLVLCLSILNGATVRIFGQSQTETARRIKLVKANNASEAFDRIVKFGRGAEFVRALMRELPPASVMNTLAWTDVKDSEFFKAVIAAHDQKADRVSKKRFENALPQASVEPLKTGQKRADLEMTNGAFFQNASSRNSVLPADAAEEPSITTVETEGGVKTTGEVQNKTETAETVITKSSNADTERILNDSKNGQIYTQTSVEEVFNKLTRGRVRNEKKFQWSYLIAQCPDANGVVEGEASVTIENKATIANTTTIAIPSQVLSMKVRLKGFVDDNAQLTHFDMTGEITETTTGYDRAKKLGMIDETALADGARKFSVAVVNNKFSAESSKSEVGEIREGSTAHLSNAENNRLMDFADTAVPMNLNGADSGFSLARTNWRNGFCVDVALTAPKQALNSGETIQVSAETVHKIDKTKTNARLEATGFAAVTPETQQAKPSAQFGLTASTDANFGGEITVKSVSKRGIGAKTLKFAKNSATNNPKPPVKKPPVKQPSKKCDGAWSGTIKVEKRKREEKRSPQSGRLLREIDTREETFSIDYSLPGIADASEGFSNAFYAEARLNYQEKKYLEKNYAPGKKICGGQMMTAPETQKFESVSLGQANERMTVFITSTGEKGILSFGSPQVTANKITTITYDSGCPAYDRTNSGVDKSLPAFEVAVPIFEIEFELDAKSAVQLNGSKTIQNEDGSETVVTWALTRDCK